MNIQLFYTRGHVVPIIERQVVQSAGRRLWFKPGQRETVLSTEQVSTFGQYCAISLGPPEAAAIQRCYSRTLNLLLNILLVHCLHCSDSTFHAHLADVVARTLLPSR